MLEVSALACAPRPSAGQHDASAAEGPTNAFQGLQRLVYSPAAIVRTGMALAHGNRRGDGERPRVTASGGEAGRIKSGDVRCESALAGMHPKISVDLDDCDHYSCADVLLMSNRPISGLCEETTMQHASTHSLSKPFMIARLRGHARFVLRPRLLTRV
jgi:hypothetical protein